MSEEELHRPSDQINLKVQVNGDPVREGGASVTFDIDIDVGGPIFLVADDPTGLPPEWLRPNLDPLQLTFVTPTSSRCSVMDNHDGARPLFRVQWLGSYLDVQMDFRLARDGYWPKMQVYPDGTVRCMKRL